MEQSLNSQLLASSKRRGPQLSLTGDGVFIPEGSDKVRYIKFDRSGNVESNSVIFEKRPSETILFSDNEIKIVQQKPEGGRAVFYLSRTGLVVPAQSGAAAASATLSATEVNQLLTFAEDWKGRAEQGNFANVVPDELLFDEVIARLTAENDTWVNLTGAFGVGKTSSLKGLAHYLANKLSNDPLMGEFDLFRVSMSGLIKLKEAAEAATKAPPTCTGPNCPPPPEMGKNDSFTLFLKSLKGKKVILIMDDFLDDPELGPTNSQKSMDFFLKTFRKSLKMGEIKILTTADNKLWNDMIQGNSQLKFMVDSINLREPDLGQLEEIIANHMRELGSKYKVSFENGVLDELLLSSQELFPRKVEPARTIDALDAMVRNFKDEDGDPKFVSIFDSRKYLLSFVFDASKLEQIDIPKLRMSIDEQIIGHEEVKEKLLSDIASLKLGVTSMNQPLGLYLFTGPTGVGKTEMAKVVAKQLDLPLVQVNMATYDGFKKGSSDRELIERKNGTPFVLLLDEVDKRTDGYASASDRLNELRSLFATGQFGKGTENELDLRNAIIIMTANYADNLIISLGDKGQEEFIDEVEKYVLDQSDSTPDKDKIPMHVWSYLRENTFIFKSLNEAELELVTKKFVRELSEELSRRDKIQLFVGDKFIERVVETNFKRKLGVVPIKAKINKTLKRFISRKLMEIKMADKSLPYPARLYPQISKVYVDMDRSGTMVFADNTNPHFPANL